MARQSINRGAIANDGQGDSLRDGADKVNANFSEIYSVLGDGNNLLTTDIDFGNNKLLFANYVETLSDLSDIDATNYEGLLIHVHETGAIHFAHSGSWAKLLADTSSGNPAGYTDPLNTVAYSGNYNDLSNRPSIPSSITDLSDITDGSSGQVLSTDGTGNFTFRDVEATSVAFANITSRPTTITGYGITDAFSGDYNALTNKPTLFDGDYDTLTNKPTIPVDVNDLTDIDNLLFDGVYTSLDNRPVIPADLNDLTDTDNLLFSRSYTDLTDKPTSFSALTSLQMALGVEIDEFSNDTAMTDNSTTALVTERAVKTFVTTQIAAIPAPTTLNGNVVGDVKGSVFADDSTLMVDAVSGIFTGNLNGSVFADDSTLLVDGVNGKLVGDYENGTSVINNTSVTSYDLVALQDANINDLYVSNKIYGGATGSIKNVQIASTAPSNSTGATGDVAGMVAFDASYIYYCTANYDGSTNIWKRVALSGDTW